MLRREKFAKELSDKVRDRELEANGRYWCDDCETVCIDLAELKAHQDLKCT